MPAVTGTVTGEGTVEISSATVLTPECTAKVKTKTGIIVETYPIVFEWDGAPEDNPVLTKLTVNSGVSTRPFVQPHYGCCKHSL